MNAKRRTLIGNSVGSTVVGVRESLYWGVVGFKHFVRLDITHDKLYSLDVATQAMNCEVRQTIVCQGVFYQGIGRLHTTTHEAKVDG